MAIDRTRLDSFLTENEEYKKFRTHKYPEAIFNAACLMAAIAPKKCEECNAPLNVAEISWRIANTIEPFLCYGCIKKHEANGTMILPPEHAGYMRRLKVKEGVKTNL